MIGSTQEISVDQFLAMVENGSLNDAAIYFGPDDMPSRANIASIHLSENALTFRLKKCQVKKKGAWEVSTTTAYILDLRHGTKLAENKYARAIFIQTATDQVQIYKVAK